MRLTEINIYGVYISPYVVVLLAVWAFAFALRLALIRLGILAHAWHPALLMFSIFVAAFSMAVLATAAP